MKLIHGEALEEMKNLPDGSIDLILTDPPFAITACKWDSVIPLEPMWEQLERIIKPNGAIVLNSAQPFTTALIYSNIELFKYCWIWEKEHATGFAFAKKQPMRMTEDICVFYKEHPYYDHFGKMLNKHRTFSLPKVKSDSGPGGGDHNLNIQKRSTNTAENIGIKTPKPEDQVSITRKKVKYNNETKTNLIYFKRDRGGHPTQKPVALMEYMINTYTVEGETVLDFTMGSGTTGMAAKNLKRDFIGIELDKEYFELASERINKAEKQISTLDSFFK